MCNKISWTTIEVQVSGSDGALADSNIYSSVTVMQIKHGSHYYRAIECHQIILQARSDLWLKSFFQKHPEIYQKTSGMP